MSTFYIYGSVLLYNVNTTENRGYPNLGICRHGRHRSRTRRTTVDTRTSVLETCVRFLKEELMQSSALSDSHIKGCPAHFVSLHLNLSAPFYAQLLLFIKEGSCIRISYGVSYFNFLLFCNYLFTEFILP